MRQDLISWTDAERVVRLHREMTGQTDQVSLSSLARSLGKTEDEVRFMLAQTRSSARPGRRRFADPGGWLSAGIAAVMVGAMLVFSAVGFVRHHFHAAGHRASPRIEITNVPPAGVARVDGADREVSIVIDSAPKPLLPPHA